MEIKINLNVKCKFVAEFVLTSGHLCTMIGIFVATDCFAVVESGCCGVVVGSDCCGVVAGSVELINLIRPSVSGNMLALDCR